MDENRQVQPKSGTNAGFQPTKTAGSDNLKVLLEELNRPLDDVVSSASQGPARRKKRSERLVERLRSRRQHRRELRRARLAAQAALGVKPRRSTRKRAAAMLSAGAVSLAAFSGPTTGQSRDFAQGAEAASADVAPIRLPAALLKASDELKGALIEEEGVRYTVYRDVAGYPTVGVGHLVRPEDNLSLGDRIDEEKALDFLESDLAEAERGVRKLVGDLPLFQHEFDALLDLVYNVGLGNVSQQRSPALNAAISLRDYDAMARELDYTHAGGSFAKGLEFRSERRAAMFRMASYDDPREA